MKKMKKLLLAVGTAATVVAPIAAVVSCGSSSTTPSKTDGGTTGAKPNAGAKPGTIPNAGAKPGTGSEAGAQTAQSQKYVMSDAVKAFITTIKGGDAAQYAKVETDFEATKTAFNKYMDAKKAVDGLDPAKVATMIEHSKEIAGLDDAKKDLPTSQGKLDAALKAQKDAKDALDAIVSPTDKDKNKAKSAISMKQGAIDYNTKQVAEDNRIIHTVTTADLATYKVKKAEFDAEAEFASSAKTLLLDGATYLKGLGGDKITKAIDKLIDDSNVGTELTNALNQLIDIIPEGGKLGIVNTAVTTISEMLTKAIDGKSATEMAEFKKDLKVAFDVIDFDKLFDKVIYYNGEKVEGLVPPLFQNALGGSNILSAVPVLSNIEGTLIGNILAWGKKDYTGAAIPTNGGIGFATLLAMYAAPMTNHYFPNDDTPQYEAALAKLKTSFPAIGKISPSLTPFIDPVLTLLFEDIKQTDKTSNLFTAGLDSLDLNLKDAGVPAFAKLISDQLEGALTTADGSKFTVGKFLNGGLAVIAYNQLKSHKDDDGILGTVATSLVDWAEQGTEGATAKITGLFKSLTPLLDGLISKVQTIVKDVAYGDGAKYAAPTTAKQFYKNIKQAVLDILSIDFSTINKDAADKIQAIFPDFVKGTLLENIVQLMSTKLADVSAAVEFTTKNFPGTKLGTKVTDMTQGTITVIGKTSADLRKKYPTYTQDQINWIFNHQSNWDIVSNKVFGKVYENKENPTKDADGKVIPNKFNLFTDGDLVDESGTKFRVPEGAVSHPAELPAATLGKYSETQDWWIKGNVPIPTSEYAAARLLMVQGKFNYVTGKGTDTDSQAKLDAAFDAGFDDVFSKLKNVYPSQKEAIRKAMKNGFWSFHYDQAIDGANIPAPTDADVKAKKDADDAAAAAAKTAPSPVATTTLENLY